jgi:hypothetical protein
MNGTLQITGWQLVGMTAVGAMLGGIGVASAMLWFAMIAH